jgi:hypothetical protein
MKAQAFKRYGVPCDAVDKTDDHESKKVAAATGGASMDWYEESREHDIDRLREKLTKGCELNP